MYDIRVIVEEVKGLCDLPMQPGDYFELRGGRLTMPENSYICMWALQSLMPLLPLKQRDIRDENDWVPHTHRIACPDPNGRVIFRIDRIGDDGKACKADIPARLLVDESKCTGCRACELACSLHHEGCFAPELARIRLHKIESTGSDIPVACRQCGNALCVSACPHQALGRDAHTKALVLHEDACTGCGACVVACPFGALRAHPQHQKPLTCDLCGGEPRCVERCAIGALQFGRGEVRKGVKL